MTSAVLSSPLLLGTAWSMPIHGVDALQQLLAQSYRVCDLEPMRVGLQRPAPLQLQAAAAQLGEVALTSVLGMPLTLAIQPLGSLCMLALPSAGWGQYQTDQGRIDNSYGQSVAFMPPVDWRLVNNSTAGTAVQFEQPSLIRRLLAMADCQLSESVLAGLLSAPFVLSTDDPPVRFRYRQLLLALSMVDQLYRGNGCDPDPMLQLDDLILRCVALLLYPQLLMLEASNSTDYSLCRHDLRAAVRELMDWMRAHLDQPISLTDVEQRSHYGRRAIQQGFKDAVGCGPMQWLRLQRLESALLQLQNPQPGLTVSKVAQACGYINLSCFSRDFRMRFGRSAREVLAASRKAFKHL